MPAGIEIINDHGSVLIDDTDFNLALRSKGSATFPNSGAPPTNFATVTLSSLTSPIFAYYPIVQDAPSGIRSHLDSFNAGVVTMRISAPEAGPCTFEWFCFDRPIESAETFGLKVFNAAGELTFDSNLKHDVILSATPITTSPQVIATPPGRKCAVVAQGRAGYVKWGTNQVTVTGGVGTVLIVVDVTGY